MNKFFKSFKISIPPISKKNNKITRGIRFDPLVWDRINDIAHLEGVCASDIVRHASELFLKEYDSRRSKMITVKGV